MFNTTVIMLNNSVAIPNPEDPHHLAGTGSKALFWIYNSKKIPNKLYQIKYNGYQVNWEKLNNLFKQSLKSFKF